MLRLKCTKSFKKMENDYNNNNDIISSNPSDGYHSIPWLRLILVVIVGTTVLVMRRLYKFAVKHKINVVRDESGAAGSALSEIAKESGLPRSVFSTSMHHQGHDLDLPLDFIRECELRVKDLHDIKYTRVMSLATYLNQLDYLNGKDKAEPAYLWRILVTQILSSDKYSALMKQIIIPLIMFLPSSIKQLGGDVLGFTEKRKFKIQELGKDDDSMMTPFASKMLRRFDQLTTSTSIIFNAAVGDLYHYIAGRENGNIGFLDPRSSLFHFLSEESREVEINEQESKAKAKANGYSQIMWNLFHLSPFPSLQTQLVPDAVDLLLNGLDTRDKSMTLPKKIPNPLVLSDDRDVIGELIENYMDLGPFPDQLHFECPKPFAPNIFPDLCLGWGGIAPIMTPRQQARGRVIAYIFNKLAANVYILAGVPPSPAAEVFHKNHQDLKEEYSKLFVLVAPDGEEIIFPERLVEKFKLACRLFSHPTSFGVMLCVRDKLPEGMKEPPLYSTDIKHKELYTQIPIAFSTRTGIRDPSTGRSLNTFSFHAGMSVSGTKDSSPFGYFELHYYLGPEGYTAFHPAFLWYRPWAKYTHHDIPAFDPVECVKATTIASLTAIVVNLAARKQGLDFGGFGFHGGSNDSIAVIETAVRGKTSLFPLTIHGEAASNIVTLIRMELLPHLKDNVLSGKTKLRSSSQFFELLKRNPDLSKQVDRMLSTINEIGNMHLKIRQDHSIYPRKIDEAIGRFLANVPETIPFEYAKNLRAQLVRVRKEWKETLEE